MQTSLFLHHFTKRSANFVVVKISAQYKYLIIVGILKNVYIFHVIKFYFSKQFYCLNFAAKHKKNWLDLFTFVKVALIFSISS